MVTQKKFRIHRKKIGLTYSCPKDAKENPIESKESLLDFLEKTNGHCQYIVAKELHESGKKHYHAYVAYDNIVDTTKPTYFDFEGVHPNIIAPGAGWMNYCRKDKEFITNIEKNPFGEAMEKETVEGALDLLWEKRPQCMAINADRIEKNIAKRMKKEPEGRKDHESYRWLPLQNIQSTILVGEAGIGKTQYALWSKHFKNPLLVSHLDRLKDFDENVHDGIVFDDMNFQHLPRTSQIHLLDWDVERDVHIRYGIACIPAHTRKIFTCNEGKKNFPFLRKNAAIERRYQKIELKKQ